MNTAGMMHDQLTVGSLIDHAATCHCDTEVVSIETDGGTMRSYWAKIAQNAERLHSALTQMGIAQGERLATLACNNIRHLEIYFGVSSSGRVCHTVNPRLLPEQLSYVLNHAEDRVLFFDSTFLPLVAKVAPLLVTVKHFVFMGERNLEAEAALIPLSLRCAANDVSFFVKLRKIAWYFLLR